MSSQKRGDVIFLTGPAGSGKTRTGMLWSNRRSRPTFFLDWDQVANVLLFAGVEAQSAESRYRRAARVCASMTQAIVEAGNDCILVGAWARDDRPEWRGTWSDVEALHPRVVVLLPTLAACLKRNSSDPSRQGAFAVPDAHVEGSHALDWASWSSQPRATVVDTTDMPLDRVIEVLETVISATG
jgi:hypothetical protein